MVRDCYVKGETLGRETTDIHRFDTYMSYHVCDMALRADVT